MGTRSDYYIMKDEKIEWLGSCGWDGYPGGIPEGLVNIESEEEFRKALAQLIQEHKGYDKNWPWPWKNSGITDYVYVFKENKVYCNTFICSGKEFVLMSDYLKNLSLFHGDEEEEGLKAFIQKINFPYPDMTKIQKVDLGSGSGLIVLGK